MASVSAAPVPVSSKRLLLNQVLQAVPEEPDAHECLVSVENIPVSKHVHNLAWLDVVDSLDARVCVVVPEQDSIREDVVRSEVYVLRGTLQVFCQPDLVLKKPEVRVRYEVAP